MRRFVAECSVVVSRHNTNTNIEELSWLALNENVRDRAVIRGRQRKTSRTEVACGSGGGTCALNRFVISQNIQRYRQLLESAADETNRRMLRALLAEEETRLAELTAQQPSKAAE